MHDLKSKDAKASTVDICLPAVSLKLWPAMHLSLVL